ncbi:hypothetical protein BJF85_14285 [Saccharomonospora sp. CUA-673]|uniref:hypothetical protein n=1 Tax=Saccharomonospora sp. CUA-673 TaxID=1904969 RepID=UPI00095F64CE|nr:hypothetical protein [Saccharomonospora sp. CUA-673]OLT47809.1 hypothetical protein BJF85_14285 [Saccharomonospora sp. CUA-673]
MTAAEQAGYNPEVTSRQESAAGGGEQMVQMLRYDAELGGSTYELVQVQTILAVPGSGAQAGQKAVILIHGTATVDRIEAVTPDMQAIVASARPAEN